MKDAFLKTLSDKLNSRKLFGWQVRRSKKTSYQSFLALTELECQRTVDRTDYVVTVYQKRKEKEEVLGLSTFKISAAEAGIIDKKIDDALFAASLVSNQIFELPGAAEWPSVEIADTSLNSSSLTQCQDRLLKALSKEKNTRLSAAEFFIDKINVQLTNHKGLEAESEETFLHTEFILLSKTGGKENEYIDRYTRRFLKDFDLEGEVANSAQLARDATQAALPKTGSFSVLLSDEPLDQLFNPVIAKTSARLKYNKMIQTDLGKSVVADGAVTGDKITLWTNPLIKGAVGSHRFDSYGTPGEKICLVKDNIVQRYLSDKRYADYLGLTPTGEMGNVEVAPGSQTFAKMLDHNGGVLYHLRAFSAFEPNAITGAFSAEIRAGYEISAKGVRPIKGGSVSGVLQKDLLNAVFSKETEQRERALVPKGVYFRSLTIAGAE